MPNLPIRVSPSGPELRYDLTESGKVLGVNESGFVVPRNANTLTVMSVSNFAVLAALPGCVIGQKVRVESVGRSYEFTPPGTSPLQPGVVLGGVDGQWHLLQGTSDQKWLSQENWYISGLTGNDEYTGESADQAIRTGLELWRRYNQCVANLTNDVTIHVLDNIEELVIDYRLLSYVVVNGLRTLDRTLKIVGNPTLITQDFVMAMALPVGNEPPIISAVGIADWTPFVGMRCRVTTGLAAGVVFWIAKVNPAGGGVSTARISVPVLSAANYDELILYPAPGDEFVIETIPSVGIVDVVYRGYLFSGSGATNDRALVLDSIATGQMRIDGSSPFDAGYRAFGCYFFDNIITCIPAQMSDRLVLVGCKMGVTNVGRWETVACFHTSAAGGTFRRFSDAYTQMSDDLFQGLRLQNFSPYLVVFDDVYICDSPSYAFAALPGSCLICQTGTLRGKGSSFGIELHGDGRIDYKPGSVPTVTGALGEVKLFEQAVFIPWTAMPWNDGLQQGTAILGSGGTPGTVVISVPYLSASQRIAFGRNTPGGVVADVSCPSASRTANAFSLIGVATDTSSFDWIIGATGYNQRILAAQS